MNAVPCDRLLLLQAEFDGELDAAQSAALADHRADCPVCKENLATLTAGRDALRGASYHAASAEFRRAIARRIGADAPAARRRSFVPWREVAGFAVGAALAATIMLAVLPAGQEGIVAALVDDHVRALQPGHLMDVVSTDQHTVKPWFDGRLDFAPPVKDLVAEGFPLVGGRLDYLGGHAVAALAYSHGKHMINLFIWPQSGELVQPASDQRDGYNVVHWTAGGMTLWAVSDLEPGLLEAFARNWQEMP